MFQMQLKVELSEEPRLVDTTDVEYDPETDDIRSLLRDICHHLASSGQAHFHVEGFGQSPWPVDVSTDLLTLLEQLPEAVASLRSASKTDFQIDFYEQGIERTLIFHKHDERIRIQCLSGTKWVPNPSEEWISHDDLNKMLCELASRFVEVAKKTCPRTTTHEWFQEWSQAVLCE